MRENSSRIFWGLCVVSFCLGAGYLYWAKTRDRSAIDRHAAPAAAGARPVMPDPAVAAPAANPIPPSRTPSSGPNPEKATPAAASSRPAAEPASAAPSAAPPPARRAADIFYRYTGVDRNYGKVARVTTDNREEPHFIDGLSCEVLYFSAGSGICLTANRGVLATYAAELFDAKFRRRARIPLQGIPSRCRISPDGTLAALTVFLSGHSYTSLNFSTQTLLLRADDGTILADLEKDFTVFREGVRISAQDFNFWGVTFTRDARRFFCTLSTAGKHYLIEGDIAAKSAKVIHDNVECPSLSPDQTRIAYKKRVVLEGRPYWQLQVLNLATGKETALAERYSVDDQLEWLDDDYVLYALSDNPNGASATTNVWRLDAAGARPPTLFLPRAYSPSVLR